MTFRPLCCLASLVLAAVASAQNTVPHVRRWCQRNPYAATAAAERSK